LQLEAELLAKPLKLTELRNALVHKKAGAVARRGNNQMTQALRHVAPL
jgi:hypothetical protein